MEKYDIVLLSGFAQVEAYRKRQADHSAEGSFAQVVATFDSWVADLWDLQGDGRALVGNTERQVIMLTAFEGAENDGLASAACDVVRLAAGLPAFMGAVEGARESARKGGIAESARTPAVGEPDTLEPKGLSARETDFLSCIAGYFSTLQSLGLVELGDAAAYLADHRERVFPRVLSVLVASELMEQPIIRHFFSSCEQLAVAVDPSGSSEEVQRVPRGVGLRFAFPSGRYAQPGIVADVVRERVGGGDIVVTGKDPLSLFAQLKPSFTELGVRAAVQASVPFACTDFGRSFLALYHYLHDDAYSTGQLTDALLTPFSGFSKARAYELDSAIRADRTLARDEVLVALRAESETFSQLEELASDPEADILLGVFEQLAQDAPGRSPAWKLFQKRAIGVLREATTIARRIGAPVSSCVKALDQAKVPYAQEIAGEGARVVVTTQPIAACMPPGSCTTLMITDATSADYPVADRDDAIALLLDKLGIEAGQTALHNARRTFSALLQLPSELAVISRPLVNENAEETYPSVVLEELIDAYREDPSRIDDIQNDYRLPPKLQEGMMQRGEELLFANEIAAPPDSRQSMQTVDPVPELGLVDIGQIPSVWRARHSGGETLERPCPPPSQIETYLECPHKWFVQNRLKVQGVDEGFGALERGSFAHEALETFYRRFQQTGELKVNEGNRQTARSLMEQVVEELAVDQARRDPSSGRYVPATELERRTADAFKRQLVDYLDFEMRLLPTFHPQYFEYEIDPGKAADYAGYQLVGKVDRIDIDDNGNAVIIDYKGSVNGEHDVVGKDPHHAGKVQTRIYAQVVRRLLGLNVVGALYVSYGKKPALSGAYDPRIIDSPHLPGMKAGACQCALVDPGSSAEGLKFNDYTFEGMLDATEALVGRTVEAIELGAVAPQPSYEGACKFCPSLNCPKRGA